MRAGRARAGRAGARRGLCDEATARRGMGEMARRGEHMRWLAGGRRPAGGPALSYAHRARERQRGRETEREGGEGGREGESAIERE